MGEKSLRYRITVMMKHLLVIWMVLFAWVPSVHAITPIVTTSSTTTSTQPSTMRHLVKTTDGTLHTFIQLGTNTTKCGSGGLWWLYSTDSGTSWICNSQLSSDTTNLMHVDVRADASDNIYIVYSVATTGRNNAYDVLYRKITYNGSSSWTLNGAQTVLDGSGTATAYHYAVLELEGTSKIWMATRYFDGTNYGITAYYSDGLTTAPTWTLSQTTIDTAGTSSLYHFPTLVRYGTNIGLIYNIESGSDMAWRYRADADGATTWNTQATMSTSYTVRGATFSAAGDTSGNIYFAASGSNTLFQHYLSSWTAIATVSSNVSSDQYISVVTDGISAWVLYGDRTNITGGVNKRIAYKKVVSPFATANFDANPTYVDASQGLFEKVWLYDASANTYQDDTADASDTDTADFLHTDSSSIVKDVGDIMYAGKSAKFDAIDWEISTAGTGAGTLVWEYCSAADGSGICTTWSALTFTASSQTSLKSISGYGAFTPPSDWQASKINSESTAYYYIRARTSVAYTVGPVGTEIYAVPPNSWGSLAQTTTGVYGVWTENSASVVKVRYAEMVTHSTAPYTPSSLGGHVTGATTADTTPSLTFTLSDPGVSDTVKYRIQIDDSSDFGSPVIDYTSALAAQGSASFTIGQAQGSGTYTTGTSGQTLNDGSYYWRVKAIDNSDGESAYALANSGGIAFVVDINYTPPTWPTAGANSQRTGWTSENLAGDIAAEWVKPIEAYVPQHVQAIGAAGNIYLATSRGLYAIDASSGTVNWVFPTELPLGHSPTYAGGVVYVGGLDHRLYAINAATGAEVWNYEAGGGFSTNPVVENGKVYAGNRDGTFYAVNTADGTLAWSYATGNQILQSAAFKAENDGIASTSQGTLYFASNDGYAYALNAQSGSLIWRSASKLPSMGFFAWWPVIYDNYVIFTRTTFGSGHTGEETDYLFCTPSVTRPVGCSPTNTWTPGALGTEIGDWVAGTATQDVNTNIRGITFADYFETFPHYRGAYFFDRVTGDEEAFDIDNDSVTDAAPIGWSGDGGTLPPPIVSGQDGVLYFRTYTRANGGFGSKTIAGWKVGTSVISVPYSNTNGQSAGWPGDEPNGMSAAGNKIYWNHCCDRYVGAVDISQPNTDFLSSADDANRQWRYITSSGLPLTSTGIGMPLDYYSEAEKYFWDPPNPGVFWNENNKVGPSIYNGKMYVVLGNALVAFSESGAGDSAPKLSAAQNVASPSATVNITPTTLTQSLETEVQEIVNAGHLKPSYLHSGNITSYRSRSIDDYLSHYWHNPADTQRILLRALPFLSSGLQTQVHAYLQNEMANYSPATYAHIGFVSGTQRDPYPYPPNEIAFNSFTALTIDKQTSSNFNNFWTFPPSNIYALWKYAQAGLGNASTLLTAWGTKLKVPIEDNFTTILGNAVNASNIQALMKSFPLISNAYIAGYQGYVELAKLAGQSVAQYGAYETELNKLLAWKTQDLLIFPDPQEPYICENECYYESLITYYNFAYLTPELATYLKENAISVDPDKDIQTVLQRYQDMAPYWMMAHNGETQGESAIQPYQQTHSLFQALAMVKGANYDTLIKYLDSPIVPTGDLYYIDNVVATLESPTGSPLPSPSPTPTPSPSPTPTPDPSPTPTPEPSSVPSPTPTPSPSPTPTPDPSPTPTPAPSATPWPSTSTLPTAAPTPAPNTGNVCVDTAPSGQGAWLYQANATSSSSITIRFTQWQSPVTHYAVEYGTESSVYTYAASNIGDNTISSFTVNALSPNTTYYFRVRTGNGCAPGAWSNELPATTLGTLAEATLVTQNFEIPDINVIGPAEVKESEALAEEEGVVTPAKGDGYDITISVVDVEGEAIEGAEVTLHSDPMTAYTDKDGKAWFYDVPEGDHRVFIAYQGYQGEQSINLSGDKQEISITITVEHKNILLDRRVGTLVAILIAVILLLMFKLRRRST